MFILDLTKIAISHANQCFFTNIILFQLKHSWSKIYSANCWKNINLRNTCRFIFKKNSQHLQLISSFRMSSLLFVIPTLLSYNTTVTMFCCIIISFSSLEILALYSSTGAFDATTFATNSIICWKGFIGASMLACLHLWWAHYPLPCIHNPPLQWLEEDMASPYLELGRQWKVIVFHMYFINRRICILKTKSLYGNDTWKIYI